MSSLVLLFKTLEEEAPSQDRFVIILKKAGYLPVLIPVLRWTFTNLESVTSHLLQNPLKINGIIATSRKAVFALQEIQKKSFQLTGLLKVFYLFIYLFIYYFFKILFSFGFLKFCRLQH